MHIHVIERLPYSFRDGRLLYHPLLVPHLYRLNLSLVIPVGAHVEEQLNHCRSSDLS